MIFYTSKLCDTTKQGRPCQAEQSAKISWHQNIEGMGMHPRVQRHHHGCRRRIAFVASPIWQTKSTTGRTRSFAVVPGVFNLAALSVSSWRSSLTGFPSGWTNPSPGLLTRAVVDSQFSGSQEMHFLVQRRCGP